MMMPIAFAPAQEKMIIRRITGPERIRKHLTNVGFTEGEPIMVINKINENLIVKLRGISLAVTCDMAAKIQVDPMTAEEAAAAEAAVKAAAQTK